MKKPIFIFSLILLISGSLCGQNYEKGDFQLKAGVGEPNWTQLLFNILPNGQTQKHGLMPVIFKAEYFPQKHMAIGLNAVYQRANTDLYDDTLFSNGKSYAGSFGLAVRKLSVALHIEYHPGWLDQSNVDVYFGGTAGVKIVKTSIVANTDLESVQPILDYLSSLGLNTNKINIKHAGPKIGIYGGLKFPIAGPLGAYFETGIGVPLISGGLVARF